MTGPPTGLDVVMFRDPFVFRSGGRRWALIGAGHSDGTPSVLLYDCDDLAHWRFAGVLLDGNDPVATDVFGDKAAGWECPQLFATAGGEWVLVVSLWDGDPMGTGFLTGRLEPDGDGGLRFGTRTGGRLDHGRDFYAPAVLQEADRALMWGWSWEAREQGEVDAGGLGRCPHRAEGRGRPSGRRAAASYRLRSCNCCARPSRSPPHRNAPRCRSRTT